MEQNDDEDSILTPKENPLPDIPGEHAEEFSSTSRNPAASQVSQRTNHTTNAPAGAHSLVLARQ